MKHLDGVPLVYFVYAEIPHPLIRVGFSTKFRSRWTALITECPVTIDLLGVQPDERAQSIKQRLHKRFARHRSHGEWFHAVPALLHHAVHETVKPASAQIEPIQDAHDIDQLLDCELPALMTIKEIAELLNVSVVTVRRHMKSRNLPFVRVGGQSRFLDTSLPTSYAPHCA